MREASAMNRRNWCNSKASSGARKLIWADGARSLRIRQRAASIGGVVLESQWLFTRGMTNAPRCCITATMNQETTPRPLNTLERAVGLAQNLSRELAQADPNTWRKFRLFQALT